MVEAEYVSEQLGAVADPAYLMATVFAEAPIAFAVAEAGGRCVVVNRAFRELFGAPPADYDIFAAQLIGGFELANEVERVRAGEAVVVPAFWYVATTEIAAANGGELGLDGRRVAIELSMTPLRDREGTVRQVALSYKDVTAVRELADERAVLRTLFEVAPEAIVTFDLDTGRIDDANDNAVRLFGYPRERLLGLGPAELSPERQPDGRWSAEVIGEEIVRARRGERIWLEWMHQSATGEPLPCEIRVVNVPADRRALCRVSIVDLRERKAVEAERERVRQLEEQNLRIHEANRLKSEFLAAMSHELRTPLNTIIGFTELIFYDRVALDSPEHNEFMGYILTGSKHLLQLINDVLDLAKVEAGKLEFRPEPLEVESVISEVTTLLRTLSLQKRIRVQIEADHSVATVMLDPARFKQVLYNYLSNALKFTPEGGQVIVRTVAETPDSFRLEVEDSGIGIPLEAMNRLFLEFEQIEGEPVTAGGRRQQGTGLGLALTRRIVEAQGGTVGVRSQPGHGSVFHAVLPRETPLILAR